MTTEEKQEVALRVADEIRANSDESLLNVAAWIDLMASEEGMDAEALASCLRTNHLLFILKCNSQGNDFMDEAHQILQAMFQLGYQTAKKD